MVEYHVEYILCVVSSDDSEIQQAYDRETDSILAMPIVSFFTGGTNKGPAYYGEGSPVFYSITLTKSLRHTVGTH